MTISQEDMAKQALYTGRISLSQKFGGPDVVLALETLFEQCLELATGERWTAENARHPAPHEARAQAYDWMGEQLQAILAAVDYDEQTMRQKLWRLLIDAEFGPDGGPTVGPSGDDESGVKP